MTFSTPHDYSHVLLVTGSRTWSFPEVVRETFRQTWNCWCRDAATRPRRALLVSGHCPQGADALAETSWEAAGFQVARFPADWQTHGRAAGVRRNQVMVDFAIRAAAQGSIVNCVAFAGLCQRQNCPQRSNEQLISEPPYIPGHFSHGTVDCLDRAKLAGIPTQVVLDPRLPPS